MPSFSKGFTTSLFLFLSLSCASRKAPNLKAPKAELNTPEKILPAGGTTVQKSSKSPFFLDYIDLDLFQLPRISLKDAPKSPELDPSPLPPLYTMIVYKACPIAGKSEEELPSVFKECLVGYTRNSSISFPLFTKEYTLELQLCKKEGCVTDLRSEKNPEHNLLETPREIKLASLLIEQEESRISLLESAKILFQTIQNLASLSNKACMKNWTKEDEASFQKLSTYTLQQLEHLFLSLPQEQVLSLLQFTKKAQTTESPGSTAKKAEAPGSTVKDIDDFIWQITIASAALASLGTSLYDINELYSWHILLKRRHTVRINDERITLVSHKQTGFLVRPEHRSIPLAEANTKSVEFYLENPATKEPLFQTTGELQTFDPKELKIRYSHGLFYEYDYVQGKYLIEGPDGKLIQSPSLLDRFNAEWGVLHKFRRKVLERNVTNGQLGDITSEKKLITPEELQNRSQMSLEDYDNKARDLTNPIFREPRTAFSYASKSTFFIQSVVTASLKLAILGIATKQMVEQFLLTETEAKTCGNIHLQDEIEKIIEIKSKEIINKSEIWSAMRGL
ncbi:MAG: hypothetical protein KA436_05285 [Oligoflexales bacterium]|nr:hypothetical protein [Oligoflexales bacterium]